MNKSDIGVLNELSGVEGELRQAEMYLASQNENVSKARKNVLWAKDALLQKELVLARAIEQQQRDAATVLKLREEIYKVEAEAAERIKQMRSRAELRRRRMQASPQELLALIAAK